MNNDGVITSYTYDKNNRLLTEGDITYTYDANGNTLTAGNKTYTYNARGQQIGYTDGTVTASYAYNPSGLRSAKTVGGSTKYFVYNGMQIVFEYEDSIASGTVYYYGLNRTHSSDGDVYVYNAHGDTVQLVNDDAVVVSYTYDAFGNLINTIGESDNAFLYCSEYFDAETETYYLRARYYTPANGRFNAEDTHWNVRNRIYGDNPIKMNEHEDTLGLNQYTLRIDYEAVLQSGNLYVYCGNNPVKHIDINGEFVITTTTLLIAGGIALFGAIGGLIGNHVANKKGATGWEKAGYIAGGVIIGGTVGAVAGYAVAPAVISATGVAGISVTAAGISTVAVTGSAGAGILYQTLEQGLNFSQKAFQHMQEPGRYVPVQTLIDAIKYGNPMADPRGSEAVMYTTEMVKNGNTYTLEVLYDAVTNTVWHFMYYN